YDRDHLESLEMSQERARYVLQQLADFCHIKRGSASLLLSSYQVETLVEVLVSIIGSYQSKTRDRVRLSIDSASSFFVKVDLDRFRSIMANLLSNALKHSR